MDMKVTIRLESPLQLGAGLSDVNIDTDMLLDEWGMPYIPAKRFRGVLYESALEVLEIFEAIDNNDESVVLNRTNLNLVFNQGENESDTYIILEDFRLKNYEKILKELKDLQERYPELINKNAVKNSFTSIRYQTAIDEKTGVAKDGSLRNMRVVDKLPLEFEGHIQIKNGNKTHEGLIAMALQNLSSIGYKRNRGYGRIKCSIDDQEKTVKKILEDEWRML